MPPTSTHEDVEVGKFYEDVIKSLQQDKVYYIITGDLSIKIGKIIYIGRCSSSPQLQAVSPFRSDYTFTDAVICEL